MMPVDEPSQALERAGCIPFDLAIAIHRMPQMDSDQECRDGEGFRDRSSGFNVATDTLAHRRLRPKEAVQSIAQSRGKRYARSAVNAFHKLVKRVSANSNSQQTAVADLTSATATTRELITGDESLLASDSHVLNERLIQKIREFEASSATPIIVYVRLERIGS